MMLEQILWTFTRKRGGGICDSGWRRKRRRPLKMMAAEAKSTPTRRRRRILPRQLIFAFELIFLVLLMSAASPADAVKGLKLSDFIEHYEPAFFSKDSLATQHNAVVSSQRRRRKRQTSSSSFFNTLNEGPTFSESDNNNNDVAFNFTAHNRLFQIRLRHDAQSVFADDVQVENTLGPISYRPERVYSGVLADTPDSSVHGIVSASGHFDGHISTPMEQYYIEPAHRYFPGVGDVDVKADGSKKGLPFHSVIYKASDVLHPSGSGSGSGSKDNGHDGCKSHELHLRRREERFRQQFLSPENWLFSDKDLPEDLLRPTEKATATETKDGPNLNQSFNSTSNASESVITPTDAPPASSVSDRHRRTKRQTFEEMAFEALSNTGTLKDGTPLVKKLNSGAKIEMTSDSGGGKNGDQQVKTTMQLMNWDEVPESVRHHFRKRKQGKKIDKKKTTCMLYLQADHLFYEKMGRSEEATIDVMTRHVQRVNSIYKEIDFDQDGKPDNITFMIKRIKVHTQEALKDPLYRFPGNYGVEKFLEIFSEENYDAFCLAYMFTYRDFEGGTLGLAWTGDLKNAGGVCERNGHYRGTLKSLNTGIVTLLNYGKHVPPAVSHVTMAHEMGHNFGSPHDPENNKVCVPGGQDGNYIMFARATSGDKKNNRKFSPCSLKSVKQVLLNKARGARGCFTEPQQALCGNGVVEEGEECDCGWEEDCQEECCWPQTTKVRAGQKPCTLRPNKVCSPTQGPCCTNECHFKVGDKCRDDNGCRDESFCDGSGPSCPMSDLKPNKTVCNKEFVCYKGECTGSICLAYGMESCQCEQGPGDSDTKACELCCKEPGPDKQCISSFQLNQAPFDIPDMFSKPGTPCNNYQGYCDVFQKCREVDPSGPLVMLRNILFSEESIESVQNFILNHWYSLLFILIALLIFMVVIVAICGKRTGKKATSSSSSAAGSANGKSRQHERRRRTIYHNSEGVSGSMGGGGQVLLASGSGGGGDGGEANADTVQVVHPVAIEASVPFGKKVRLGENRSKKSGRSRGGENKSSNEKRPSSKSRKQRKRRKGDKDGDENNDGSWAIVVDEDECAGEARPSRLEGAFERASRLAANLSQLIANLPPETASPAASQQSNAKLSSDEANQLLREAAQKPLEHKRNKEKAMASDGSAEPAVTTPGKSSCKSEAVISHGTAGLTSSASAGAIAESAASVAASNNFGHNGKPSTRRARKAVGSSKRSSSPSRGAHKRHKSLSPEKRVIASSLTSISKSFEKLDIIAGAGHRRLRAAAAGATKKNKRRRSAGGAGARSSSADANDKRKRKPTRKSSELTMGANTDEDQRTKAEVTIAKLGRFKFSLEVKPKAAAGGGGGGGAAPLQAQDIRRDKKRQKQQHSAEAAPRKKSTTAATASTAAKNGLGPEHHAVAANSRQHLAGGLVAREERTSYERSASLDNPATASASAAVAADTKATKVGRGSPPGGVILSKKRPTDRPLRPQHDLQLSPSASTSSSSRKEETDQVDGLDYRLSFNRHHQRQQSQPHSQQPATAPKRSDKFTRSVSHPGPAPNPYDLMFISPDNNKKPAQQPAPVSKKPPPPRKYSFASENRPDLEKLYQLRHSNPFRASSSSSSSTPTTPEEEPEKEEEEEEATKARKSSTAQRLGNTQNGVLLLNSKKEMPAPLNSISSSKRKSSTPSSTKPLDNDSSNTSGLSRLKKQLQSQLDQAGTSLSDVSLTSTSFQRRRRQKQHYQAMDDNDEKSSSSSLGGGDDDDDVGVASCSSDDSSTDSKQRLSPPTQVQSLSEASSSNEGDSSSKIASPSNFGCGSDDEDDSSLDDMEEVVVESGNGTRAKKTPSLAPGNKSVSSAGRGEAISRKRILAAVGIHSGSLSSSGGSSGKGGSGGSKIPEASSRTKLISSPSSSSNSSIAEEEPVEATTLSNHASDAGRIEKKEQEEHNTQIAFLGCENYEDSGDHCQRLEENASLDYVKDYGEVPRFLQNGDKVSLAAAAAAAGEAAKENKGLLAASVLASAGSNEDDSFSILAEE